VPDNNGICEYIKEVREESKYIKPLEITRKFANDDMIMAARRGEHMEKEVEADESGSGEKFFDAEDEVHECAEVSKDVPDVPAPTSVQQKEKAPARVDPSIPTGNIPDSVFMTL
ncbi:hypothetical protein Dimus_033287, partial [Dionaea muscipula]